MDSSPAGPSAIQAGSGSSPFGLIFFFILLMLGAVFFAAAETALSSVNRIRMISYADDGDKRAKRVLYILDHFDKAITTILIGTNIMQIGCATLSTLLATGLWGDGAVGISTAVTTVIMFFFAETLPKTFAVASSEKIAMMFSGVLVLLMRLFSPISFLYGKLATLAKKPFKKNIDDDVTVTEDELADIIETVAKEGAIDEDRTELMQSALQFQNITVSEALTPWSKVLTVRTDMPSKQIAEIIGSCSHSRLPVLNADNEVVGVLQIRKYLKTYIQRSGKLPLYRVMDKPQLVQADTPIDELLETLSLNKTHIAIVCDKDKEPTGIITVEDILEELVGEIYDEDDEGVEA